MSSSMPPSMPNGFPQLISASYQRRLDGFQASHCDPTWLPQRLAGFPKYPLFTEHLQLLWGTSDFVGEHCETHPELFQQLVDSGDLQRSYSRQDFQQAIDQRLLCRQQAANGKAPDEEQLATELRLFRSREQMRIIWRDFSRQASMPETTRELTWMAEAAIKASLGVLHPITCEELGAPFSGADQGATEQGATEQGATEQNKEHNEQQQKMLVLAMGKMGAEELNLSSDIDLIFAYPEKGETRRTATSPRGKTVSNQEFFTRLGQKLIAALDRQTADGFVFRVDMRLRPYGQSGALVMSFDALEEYYLTQGREWERFAMVKARAVAGESEDIQRLDDILRPFIYRKYLDFGSIDALRDLKRSINRELKRKGMQTDIKLGPGGIREIEFITQAFQLVRGGRNSALQTPSLSQALEQLAADQIIESSDRDNLWQAYCFLRNTEHALQGIADKQTQQLPEDELGQQRVALIVGCANWDDFQQQLETHRDYVMSVFEDMFADPDNQDGLEAEGLGQGSNQTVAGQGDESIWCQPLELAELLEHLQVAGYQQPQAIAEQLYGIYQSKAVIGLDLEPRSRLDKLMPNLVGACAATENNSVTLSRVVGLVQAVLRRSAYLVLLAENPSALQQLVLLCQSSSWIAEQLTAYPVLLDELLDRNSLYTVQSKGSLQDQLRQQMLRVADDDLEQQMEVIRYFVRSNSLRVAACDITEVIPLMQVSDYLTWIAEVVIDYGITIAWQHLSRQYGQPQDCTLESPDFIVLGYGKLGGIELGYKSDLDLVFLHRGIAGQTIGGPRSIDNSTFYVRLGQRIIHLLSTVTASGAAYEIDMRLRPSGNSGMLVSSLAAFEKYQRETAWTWEHQALVRARFVAGNKKLGEEFNLLRKSLLQQHRSEQLLRAKVVEMREKMRKHLGQTVKDGKYSLKQGVGGIVDIEFMVQFAVLAWSHSHPEISRWSDTIRILESLAQCGLISEQKSGLLIDAYKRYRSAGHRLQLQNQLAEVSSSEFLQSRELVTAEWKQLFTG